MINAILEIRQSSWQAAIEDLDMARNSCKAWKLFGKLNNDYTKPTQQHSNITANQIAQQLLLNGKTPHFTRQFKPNVHTDGCNPNFTKPFCLTELKQCINSLKNGKATGLDNIMTKELKHFGHKALVWLLQLLNNCLALMRIPKICLSSINQSINQFYFIFVQISIHRNKLHSSGQKKETMAKRYTLIHAHE